MAPRRHAAISSSMRAGPSLCWTCHTGAWLAGRSLALARSRSPASVSRPGKKSSPAPGAAEPAARRSGRRPAVAPVWCAGRRPLSWVSTVMSRSEVAVAGRGQVTRRGSPRVHRERLRYQPRRVTVPASTMAPRPPACVTAAGGAEPFVSVALATARTQLAAIRASELELVRHGAGWTA